MIIHCNECQGVVSNNAMACPHCGNRIRETAADVFFGTRKAGMKINWGARLSIIIVILLVMAAYYGGR